ncbi:MAG TPA: SIS domain-containing protein [Solirubrobacteraceae bacterium]|nr:SIS domain-containing protein [Solirubrobacteraceae bacterium]
MSAGVASADATRRFLDAEADRLARLCHRMAERFARSGRLLALGDTPAARSDARHVAVEFVHPVIVGKRALPALALTAEGGPLREQVSLLAAEADIVIAFGAEEPVLRAVALARERGCLTIAFAVVGAEHEFIPSAGDPWADQEIVETLYHVLWELVHVFFDHRGLLVGRAPRATHDAGASSFLYPFLDEREQALEPVVADVRESVRMKAAETAALRAQTLGENADALQAAGVSLRECFAAGGMLLALGNGGSATDAMDVVADLRAAGHPAIDLTEDTGIITAVANDIGVEAIFLRQVIAYGRPGDALLALSTSGNSANLLAALAQARRLGLITIAMVGYDGGVVAADRLADHVIITHSDHIPRIQEAQATAYHALCRMLG